jgi:hypothetical protein
LRVAHLHAVNFKTIFIALHILLVHHGSCRCVGPWRHTGHEQTGHGAMCPQAAELCAHQHG